MTQQKNIVSASLTEAAGNESANSMYFKFLYHMCNIPVISYLRFYISYIFNLCRKPSKGLKAKNNIFNKFRVICILLVSVTSVSLWNSVNN